jgi:hypothetical protein
MENKMIMAYGTHGREEKSIQSFQMKNAKEGEHYEELDADRRIILK